MAEAVIVQAATKHKSQSANTNLSLLKTLTTQFQEGKSKSLDSLIPKPEIWARIRPSPKFDDNIFKVDESGKHLCVRLDDPYSVKETYVYPTDGILYNTSQEETFHLVADDLVHKALNGASVLFLVLGSSQSGKKFTLFGPPGKYDHRGLIPRTVDKICNKLEVVNNEKITQLFISGVQISQNHIKDLVTMTPYNIDCIGANGPSHKLAHEIFSRDEACAILHRIFSVNRSEKEKSGKFHMFIYLDICVLNVNDKVPIQKSRITFAKVASIPKRENLRKNFGGKSGPCIDYQGCSCEPLSVQRSIRSLVNSPSTEGSFPYVRIKCCRRKLDDSDKLAEITDIRRDLFFLEQLFVRANTLRKLGALKLKRPDLVTKYMMKLQLTPSQFIRQCKLTHCLKDMCKIGTEIRVLIHVRPEAANIDTAIDSLKFAERAKGIPLNVDFKKRRHTFKHHHSHRGRSIGSGRQPSIINGLFGPHRQEGEDAVANLVADAEQNGAPVTVELNPYQVRMIHQQINQYFTEKLEAKEVTEKPLKKPDKKPTVPFNAVVTQGRHAKTPRSKQPTAASEGEGINEIPTPPPSVADEALLHQPLSTEQHEMEKKMAENSFSDNGKSIEKEKSADIIFKKDDDKHRNKKGRKDDLKSRMETPKKEKNKRSLSSPSPTKRVPSSAKASARKKKSIVNIIVPTPPNTAPLDAKEKKKMKMKEEKRLMKEEMGSEDAPPNCLEVWNAFLQSRSGYRSFWDVKRTLDALSKKTSEQNNVAKYSGDILEKIVPLQMQVDDYKSERFLQANKKPERIKKIQVSQREKELRENIKILQLSRDPLLVRLCNMKHQTDFHQTNLENYRKSCENAFQLFALHHFGMLFPVQEIPVNSAEYQFDPKAPPTPPANNAVPAEDDIFKSGKPKRGKWRAKSIVAAPSATALALGRKTRSLPQELLDSLHSKRYENISKVGKVQARILRKINNRRPPWVKYY